MTDHAREPSDYQLVTVHAEWADRMYYGGKQRERYLRETTFIETLIQRYGLGSRVIDVGCGTGVHIQLLGQRGLTVDGFDLRPDMVAVAAKRNPDARILVGDMRDFPLEGPVDTLICMYGAINYLETEADLRKTFGHFYSHLSTPGMAVIDTRCYDRLPSTIEYWVEPESILVKRWLRADARIGVYRVFYTVPSAGIMVMEDHRQYFQDPFLLQRLLRKAGFGEVTVYDNYDTSIPFEQSPNSYKPVVVAIKR